MPSSELPVQTAITQVVTAALTGRREESDGLRRASRTGAHRSVVCGRGAAASEGVQSGGVLEQALVDELGSDYRRRITEGFTPAPDVALTRRRILMPDFTTRRRYRAERDLSYGEFGARNQLDVWRRSDLGDDARAPVLLQVHGGAWMMGSKEGQAEPLMAHLAERGWVCVHRQLPLSPRSTWPDHIVDVKRALAWTKANIAEHGGDPDFVVITGGSAGGHLCVPRRAHPEPRRFQPGFEDADTSVAAAVPFYGVYDFTDATAPGEPT